MNWDPHWEEIFKTRDWGRYPSEELVRFMARNYYECNRSETAILEVGCGPGPNIWYLSREGFDTYGIDGSETAIQKARDRLDNENLKAHLRVGSISKIADVYPDVRFDAVVDIACLQHDRLQAIRGTVEQILVVLKPGGKIFSMMMAAGSYGDGIGKELEPGTFTDADQGPLKGVGIGHFLTVDEAKSLFGQFAKLRIDHITRSLDNRQHIVKQWVI